MEKATDEAAADKIGGRIEKEQIRKAVDAVLKWERSRKNRQKAQLLDDDQLLYLIVALKKHPEKVRTNPYQISIPYPLFSLHGAQDVCLFVNDRKGLRQKEVKQKLAEENIPITKVIGLSKLKSDYVPYEAKRKLCGSYDLFLAERSVLPSLPKHLGKAFFRKKKHPIPVDLTKKDWRKQIEAVCGSTFFYIKGGTCSVLKVGRFSQTNDEIVENIWAAIEGVTSVVPTKWKNIRAMYLKTLESLALPLYQALPEMPLKINVLQRELNLGNKSQAQESINKAKKRIGDTAQHNNSVVKNDSTDTDETLLGAKRSRDMEHAGDLNVLGLKGIEKFLASSLHKKRHKRNIDDTELEKVENMAKSKTPDFNAKKEKPVMKDLSPARMNLGSARRSKKSSGDLALRDLGVRKNRKSPVFSKERDVKKKAG